MANESVDVRIRAVVCARCGAYGDCVRYHPRRAGDGERVLWFCPSCLAPHHHPRDATGGTPW